MRLSRLLIPALLVLPLRAFSTESPDRYTLPAVETHVAPDPRVLPPGTGKSHGGYFVMTALNWYARRMAPDKPAPPILPNELRALAIAAAQSECDLYIVEDGRPALTFGEAPS